MPFFPLKRIAALAESQAVYLRGVRGYNTDWVRDFESSANAFYPEYVTATVQTESECCHVEVGFDAADEAEYIECNCGHFHPDAGACKHVVAVLVHKYYQDMIAGLPTAAELMAPRPAQTDPAARRLIDHYMTRGVARQLPQPPTPGEAVLTPTLCLRGGEPILTFTVGITRTYAIRHIAHFAELMAAEETEEYGAKLRLLHRPDSFRADSRPLLEFLLDEWSGRSGIAGGTANELRLTPAGFDRFFALMAGKTVALREEDRERQILLTDGDPVLPVTVEREQGGVRLVCEETLVISGVRRMYLLHRSTLYRTGAEYARRMTAWVRAAGRAADGLLVGESELPAFCAGVLSAISPYIRPDGDTDVLEQYRPRPLHTEIRLDAPAPDTVTADVICRYGEDEVRPFAGAGEELQPWRDPLAEARLQQVIRRHFTAFQPQTGLLVLHGDDDRLFDFISRGVEELRRIATVYASDSFDELYPGAPPRLSVGVGLVSGLLEMEVDMPDVSREELMNIITGYREGRAYHRLHSGRFVALDDEALSGLSELVDGLELTDREWRAGKVTLPRYRALYLEAVLRRRHADVRSDGAFRGLVERCRAAARSEYEVPASLRPVLRRYQREGYRWLRTMEALGFGGILADDMGLGKTVQVIALLLAAAQANPDGGPSLVVCPTSLVLNWEREIARFAPALRVLRATGTAAARREALSRVASYDVVLTSYDMLKRDIRCYEPLTFHYQILDEAQYIKNSNTQNARSVKAVSAAQRFALTGTPVENRLSELWSIFDFLMPGLLYTYNKFRQRFEQPIVRQGDARALEQLNKMVSPFILRRLKADVLTELPPKTERVLPAEMELPQQQVYAATLAMLRRRLERSGGTLAGEERVEVLTMLTRLRQICCDPRLCCEGYTGGSCKLDACVELVKEAAAGGHKVLLFSQFTSMLELLRRRLREEGVSYYLLQGSTPAAQRAQLVDAFNTDDTAVFLISLKAGGTGLNLTGADVVIHYDPWWNLSAQNQATDRAHRIGQKNPVQVIRLVVRDTIEERILQMQEDKWQLAESVISADGPAVTAMSAEEILGLLE